MMRLRHIVRSALCCLLCLTVCAVPALAGNEQYTDGFLYWSNNARINIFDGVDSFNLLNGYFPATISGDGQHIENDYRNFVIRGRPYDVSTESESLWTFNSIYVEVLFSVPAPLTVSVSGVVSSVQGSVMGYLQLVGVNSSGDYVYTGNNAYASRIDCIYDSDYVSTTGSSPSFTVTSGTYDVKRYFGYRYYFDSFREIKSEILPQWVLALSSNFNGNFVFSDPDFVEGIFDEVTVNTGVLQEISGKLTEIQTSTTQIQNDVSEINDGLQDSNSSIWQSFKDSVSGLFVPSSGELEGVKDGFDQLAQEKLGGAYQTVELVDNGVQSVVNKFKNPGSSPGVEFPGISVPLGGDVGTVTLAASQTVTIPEEITAVLYPVAGVIIPIVCVIWTIRQCTDMVECFMSGMSYAEFLHRNSDEEDDEV